MFKQHTILMITSEGACVYMVLMYQLRKGGRKSAILDVDNVNMMRPFLEFQIQLDRTLAPTSVTPAITTMPTLRQISGHEQQPHAGPDKRKRESDGKTAMTADHAVPEIDVRQPSGTKVDDTRNAPAAAKKPKSEKKPKPNKDPNAPKRAQSAWNCFQSEMWARIKSESTVSIGDSNQIKTRMSEQWRQLNPEEKAKYENLAEIDKKRYEDEMRMYKKQSKGGMDGFVTKLDVAHSHAPMGNGMLFPKNERISKGISPVNVQIKNEIKSEEPRRVSTDSELGAAVNFPSMGDEPINSLGLTKCPARSSSKKVKQEKVKTKRLNTMLDNNREKVITATAGILSELEALKKPPNSMKSNSHLDDDGTVSSDDELWTAGLASTKSNSTLDYQDAAAEEKAKPGLSSGVKSKSVSCTAGKTSANYDMKESGVDDNLCIKVGAINKAPKDVMPAIHTVIASSKHEANDANCNLDIKTEGMDLSVKDSVQMKLTGATASSDSKTNFEVKAGELGMLNIGANFAGHQNNLDVNVKGLGSSPEESSGIEDDASLGSKSLLSPFKTSKQENDGPGNAPRLAGIKPCNLEEKWTTSSSSCPDHTNDDKENTANVKEQMASTTSNEFSSRREGQIQLSLVPITPEESRKSLELRHLNIVNKYKIPEDEDPRMTIHLSSGKELIIGRNKSTGIKSEWISRNLCTLSISDSSTTASTTATLLVKKPQKMHGVHVDGKIVDESQKAVLSDGSILSLYGPYGYAYQVEVSMMD
eukprot:scaffold29125_cov64-Cyclotella_meneghiniana.AAC.1